MAFTTYSFVSEKVLSTIQTWNTIPDTLVSWILPVIAAAVSCQVAWAGLNVVRGAGGRDHLLDVFFQCMRPFFVVSLGLAAGAYSDNVLGLITSLREDLTGLFANGTTNPYVSVDETMTNLLKLVKKIYDSSFDHINIGVVGSTDLSGFLEIAIGSIIFFAVAVFCAFAGVVFIGVDVALAVFFAMGPLFIASLAFAATTTFFNSWVSSILKYVFTALVMSALLTMANSLIDGWVATIDVNGDLITSAAIAVTGTGVMLYLAGKAGIFGGELIGSAAMSIGSIAKGLKGTADATKSVASGAKMAAGGVTAAYGAAQNIGRGSSLGQKAMESTAGMRAARGAGAITGSR